MIKEGKALRIAQTELGTLCKENHESIKRRIWQLEREWKRQKNIAKLKKKGGIK